MTNKEAIYLLKRIEKDAEHYGRISMIGRHGEIAKAIEALEKMEHKCENCDHRNRRRIDFDKYWCSISETEVYSDMSCPDWSEEE